MSLNRINKTTGEAIPVCSGTYYADLPIGAIIPFSGAIAPRDFLIADGRAVSRTTYKELFAVIGTTYGSGDGVNTFNVPDLRETVPVGIGENGTATIAEHDVYTLGEFKDDQLKDHYHGIKTSGSSDNYTINTLSPNVNTSGVKGWGNPWGTQFNPATTTHGKQLGVNYIIKAKSTAVPYDYKEYIDNKLEEGGFDAPFNLKEYIQNQNVLSEYEDITLPTTAATAMTMPYDGVYILANYGVSTVHHIYLNGIEISGGITGNATTGATTSSTIPFKKGDTMYRLNTYSGRSLFIEHVAYYKLRDYSGR